MLYFMILTILQSFWSSLQKVFCASSCRTLHWIVLPSSIDLHYPHTVNTRTYSLSLLPCVNVFNKILPYPIFIVTSHTSFVTFTHTEQLCDCTVVLSLPLGHDSDSFLCSTCSCAVGQLNRQCRLDELLIRRWLSSTLAPPHFCKHLL